MEYRVLAISNCVDGFTLVAVRRLGVYRYDCDDLVRQDVKNCHVGTASVAKFSAGASLLFTAGMGYIRMQRISDEKPSWVRQVDMFDAVAIDVSYDASRCIVGASNGDVFVLNSKDGTVAQTLHPAAMRHRTDLSWIPTAVALSPTGAVAYASTLSQGVLRWEVGKDDTEKVQSLSGFLGARTALHLKNDKAIVCGDSSGMIHFVDTEGDMPTVGSFTADAQSGSPSAVTCIAHQGPVHLLIGMANGRVVLHSAKVFENGSEEHVHATTECSVREMQMQFPISNVAFCDTIGRFAVACSDSLTFYRQSVAIHRDKFTPTRPAHILEWVQQCMHWLFD